MRERAELDSLPSVGSPVVGQGPDPEIAKNSGCGGLEYGDREVEPEVKGYNLGEARPFCVINLRATDALRNHVMRSSSR